MQQKRVMKVNSYFYAASSLLKLMYKDDLTAMAQIMIAEQEEDVEVIMEYLKCVETYINMLKDNL